MSTDFPVPPPPISQKSWSDAGSSSHLRISAKAHSRVPWRCALFFSCHSSRKS